MVIMESRRIAELRQEYLRKTKGYRDSNRTIIYLDETWFDTHDVVKCLFIYLLFKQTLRFYYMNKYIK
jgi:hypothetical protein